MGSFRVSPYILHSSVSRFLFHSHPSYKFETILIDNTMAANNNPSSTVDGNSSDEEPSSQPILPNQMRDLTDTLESIVRITLAGFGGSVVGLAQQRQQPGTATSSASNSTTSANNRNRQRPPMAAARVSQMSTVGNQPRTWALSCMIFALILETSRRSSPTTAILQSASSSDEESLSFNDRMKRKAGTTIGDYAIGGTAAGLVGALAGWTQNARTMLSANAMQIPASILSSKAGRRPLLIWGLGAGMSLGLVAGFFQAGIDGLSMYLQREQEQSKQSEQRDENSTA
jgi:hypothetical protein